jgi:hypothetical protein
LNGAYKSLLSVLIICCLTAGCGYKTSPRPATATIPGEINSVDARAYPDKIVLEWKIPRTNTDGSKLGDVSGFKIYRVIHKPDEECQDCLANKPMSANIDFEHPLDATIENGKVTYTDNAVSAGNVYTYAVKVYNLRGRESNPSPDLLVSLENVPGAPQGLRAGRDSAGSVELTWRPSADETIRGYRIYGGPTDKVEAMKFRGAVKASENSFIDKDADKDAIRYYVIRSFRMTRGISLESYPSSVITATSGAKPLSSVSNQGGFEPEAKLLQNLKTNPAGPFPAEEHLG